MTLSELRKAHPDKFYPQTWYAGEAFMEREAGFFFDTRPVLVRDDARIAKYSAAELAYTYLLHPEWPEWKRYLWTSDFDSKGQQVYVGDNGKGLEIHRHITITEQFAVPLWR